VEHVTDTGGQATVTIETILSYWFVLLIVIGGVELLGGEEERRSARRRWPANLALVAISAGMASVVPVGGLAAAHWARDGSFGLLNALDAPLFVAVPFSAVVLSLNAYLLHLASHKIPFLWRFHKIHHSDQALDVTTTFRTHPMIYLMALGVNLLVVVVLGLTPGVFIAYAAIVLAIDLSHHSTIRIPDWLDRALRPYMMTPSLHHIHHSDHVAETDTNYGHDIALWDRLFGTYLAEAKRPASEFRYGLKKFPPARADDLNALLIAPFDRDPFS